MAFTMYSSSLLELEKRHGVPIGNTFATDTKCKNLLCIVESVFKKVSLMR